MSEEFGPLAPYCPHKRPKNQRRKYSPSSLWNVWVEYAAWVNANPISIPKQSLFKGKVVNHSITKFRPYLKSEFLRFAKLNERTWRNYSELPEYEDIIQDIENIMYEQRLIGGYVEVFNTTITSQDLGMKTRIEETTKNADFEEFLDRIQEERQRREEFNRRRRGRRSD